MDQWMMDGWKAFGIKQWELYRDFYSEFLFNCILKANKEGIISPLLTL